MILSLLVFLVFLEVLLTSLLGLRPIIFSGEDVDILGVYYLVMKALIEEAIETASIVRLEALDNSCVARLNLRGRVWW
jgi:hypothetical protein